MLFLTCILVIIRHPSSPRGATLAHYESYFLSEAGTILPAAARTVHLDALAATLPQVGTLHTCSPVLLQCDCPLSLPQPLSYLPAHPRSSTKPVQIHPQPEYQNTPTPIYPNTQTPSP
jgi:hypothetical protein